MRRWLLPAAAIAAVAACDDPGGPWGDDVADAAASITVAEMHDHIAYLSDDELRGRDSPSAGLALAAQYVGSRFRDLGLEAAGSAGFVHTFPLGSESADNVIALLRGGDPELAGSYVVVSAHYDHLGVHFPDASGDSVYNGADDNASGTAALIEVAEAFASVGTAPARSVLFIAFAAEEDGLIGSAHWVSSPTVPADSIVANINLDMIARNAGDSIYAVGGNLTTLGALLRGAAADGDVGLHVDTHELGVFHRSDQYSFARNGVPAVLLHSGLHADYHRPSDELELVDAGKATRVARLAFLTAWLLATSADEPEWTASGELWLEQLGP